MNGFNLASSLVGNFAKMTIIAFKSSSYIESSETGRGFFLAQVNPKNYSVSYRPQYNACGQGDSTASYDPKWSHNQPRTMSFEFLFDGTGAVPHPLIAGGQEIGSTIGQATGSSNNFELPNDGSDELTAVNEIVGRASVLPQIKLFERTVYQVQGETHMPNYLIVYWGSLLFKCRLSQMDVNYKLFTPEGLPLRATINATFHETLTTTESDREISRESSDITHLEVVRAGDTLPTMAKRVYGDERYYVAVAKANNLIGFRQLQPGQQIYFPPIKKGV